MARADRPARPDRVENAVSRAYKVSLVSKVSRAYKVSLVSKVSRAYKVLPAHRASLEPLEF